MKSVTPILKARGSKPDQGQGALDHFCVDMEQRKIKVHRLQAEQGQADKGDSKQEAAAEAPELSESQKSSLGLDEGSMQVKWGCGRGSAVPGRPENLRRFIFAVQAQERGVRQQ